MRNPAIALLAAACGACATSGHYTTPRTVGDEHTQWVAGPEVGFRTIKHLPKKCVQDEVDCAAYGESREWPIPHFAHRTGFGDRLELGIHFPVNVGLDLKWHAIHAGPLDIGFMPRTSIALLTLRRQALAPSSGAYSGVMLELPVLLSITGGPLTFVAAPGPVMVIDGLGAVTHGVRGTFGIEWAPLPGFALQPEFSLIDEYAGPVELNWAIAGIAFKWRTIARARD